MKKKICGESILVMRPISQSDQGGSIPTSPLFLKSEWVVRTISLATAKELVRKHHYTGRGSNTAVYRHGLFRVDDFWESQCKGAAWWIPPTKTAAASVYPNRWQGVLSLSRLVVVPGVPKNACSFLIRHSMRLIDRELWPCLVTYADAELAGHTGKIYTASGWTEAGWTKPERVYTREGEIVSRKAGPKTRTHDQMVALGCECIGRFRRKRFLHIHELSGK